MTAPTFTMSDLADALKPKGTEDVVALRTAPLIAVDTAFIMECIREMQTMGMLGDRPSKLQKLGAWLLIDTAGFPR